MKLIAVTLSFHTASVDDLERVSVMPSRASECLLTLGRTDGISETVLLATCNRTEVYAWGDERSAPSQLTARFEEFLHLPTGWLTSKARVLVGDDAVRHLFLVTVGLESMVPGEWQIQGQVREAYRSASEHATIGPNLDRVFRAALSTGRRARAESGLDDVRASLPDVGVRALGDAIGGLTGRSALVIGAGKMARAAVESLLAEGAEVRVTARRPSAARTLAATLDRCAVAQETIEEALPTVDAVVYATAAPHVLLMRSAAQLAMARRSGRTLGVLDLGLPRNVDPEVGAIPGIALFHLERLFNEGFTAATSWTEELARLRSETLGGAEKMLSSAHARGATDFVVSLQALADDVAAAETERVLRKAPDLDERTRSLVSAAVTRAVRKVLHAPTTRGKEAAARGDAAGLATARWLFGLDGDDPTDTSSDESAMPVSVELGGHTE